MSNKSCTNCKRCTRIIRQHDESKNIYLCYQYYCNGDAIDVTPPYDDPCEMWEGKTDENA